MLWVGGKGDKSVDVVRGGMDDEIHASFDPDTELAQW